MAMEVHVKMDTGSILRGILIPMEKFNDSTAQEVGMGALEGPESWSIFSSDLHPTG